MREVELLRQLNRSYRALHLSYLRFAAAILLMLLTAMLEMAGLSLLYPLVLALQNGGQLTGSWGAATLPLADQGRSKIVLLLAGIAVFYVAKNVTLFFTYRYDIDFAMYYYKHLIRGLYSAYICKPVLQFKKESAGSLANVICVESSKLIDHIVRPLLVVITELMLLIGIGVVVGYVNPYLLALVVVTCGGTAGIYYLLLRGKAMQWGRLRMDASASLQELVANTAAGISEIKVFGKEEYLTSKLYDTAVVQTRMFRNLEMFQQGPRFLIESVFIVTFVAFFIVRLVLGADLSVLLAQFAVIAAASFRILPCLNRLVGSYSTVSFYIGPALSLMETIGAADFSREVRLPVAEGAAVKVTRGSVVVDGVSFKYEHAAQPVLRGVDLSIAQGERVGVLGASGSGKSTLIDILAGLYDPTEGAVLADTRPVAENPRAWRASIGYVPQTPFIMPGTIHENVVFGAELDDSRQVLEVVRRVGLGNLMDSLPRGIESEIGAQGANVSGGQRQLICLARALYRNPAMLLLDEPTASLDRDSEEMVMQAVRGLPRSCTIVMVSHKAYNFAGFDAVYRCENGELRADEFAWERKIVSAS